jgi:DNA-binding CsgD family transcriptional regulator
MELLQIVRTSIDTFHRQDLDAWLAPFAPDGTLSDSAAAQQLSHQAVYKEQKAAYNERRGPMDHRYEQKTGSGSMHMRLPSPSTRTGMHAEQLGAGGARLHGRWLLLARLLWLAMFVLTLVVFCANLLVGSYGLVTTILLIATTSMWFAVALVLFWRKSGDQVILLFSLQLVLTGGVFFPPLPLALFHYGAWWVPIDLLGFLATVMLSFVYTFPDGRFVPGFARWLALGWIVVFLVPVPIPGAVYPWNWWLSLPYTLVRITFYGSLALALLYRYRRRATPLQRQQIKWVVFAATLVVGAVSVENLSMNVLPSSFPALAVSPQLHHLVAALALYLLSVLIPLSIGIALLRYRLWDIDMLINRTLVYGVLTLSTVALYILIVVGLGTLLQAQGNLGLALLATGLVAVAFQPLRTRLQRAANHLMYGERDDPYHVISRLGQRLEATLAPDAVLPTIVETVAQALKGANQAEILRAIRAVASGEAIFGPGIAKRVLGFFAAARPSVPARVFPELSERERELLALIAQGRANQEIAEQLGLTLKTVRNHVSNIFSKLQVADRAQAVIRAREAGLGYGKTEGRPGE